MKWLVFGKYMHICKRMTVVNRRLFFLLYFLYALIASGQNTIDQKLGYAKNMLFEYPDSSVVLFRSILVDAEKTNNVEAIAESNKGIGVGFYYLQKYDSSLVHYKAALECRLQSVVPVSDSANLYAIAGLYNNMALVYEAEGKFSLAKAMHFRSEKIRKMIGDEAGLAQFTYTNLGGIFFAEGDYAQAIQYFYQALVIYIQKNDRVGMANALDQIGAVYFEQNDFSKARNYYSKALGLRRLQNDSLAVSYSLNNLGLTAYSEKEYAGAIDFFRRAIDIKIEFNDVSGLSSAHNNLGLVFQDLKELDSALLHSKLAVMYAVDCANLNKEAVALVNVGAVYRLQGLYGLASENLFKALKLSEQNGYLNLIRDAASQLAELYEAQSMYADAYKMKSLEKTMSDSLLNRENLKKIAVAETKFRYENKMATDSLNNVVAATRKDIENKQVVRRQQQISIFILLLSILIIAIVWLIFRSSRLKLRLHQDELKRRAAELENTLLRSQMNPHFIFNSMNSIQGFISANDTLSAERYLAKFARLIRHILENSAQEYILLSEELDALKLYLELEQARFRNKFTWEIKTDSSIDAESIMVPPLIIQPFVENAILHGILHLQGNGKIEIELMHPAEGSKICCIVSDNGVGRLRAAELRKETPGKKKSIGIGLTGERLRLSDEDETQKAIVVEDLFDEAGLAAGTRVKILIPFVEE